MSTQPLRILEVGLEWPPETFIATKLRCLAERGLDVRLGAFMPDGRAAPPIPGLKLERLPVLTSGIDRVAGHLRDLDPDVLHFEWMTVASTCLALLEAWDGPVVVSCRGSELPAGETSNGRPPAGAVARVFERADAVHLVNEAKRQEATRFGMSPSKASVIRTGVDTELFRPAADGRERDELSVVSIGWLRWLKGYEYTLLAIAELADEGIPVRLDILGGDPLDHMGEQSERARILHAVRDLGLDGRVHVHGHVETAAVAATLQRADVLLHSSLSEGLPNVVVEAMACAVPVVATDVGGTREAVRHGIEGFLVPPRDPAAAAAALRQLWADPGLRERMGRAGRARAESEFTLERLTDQWVELYERVALRSNSDLRRQRRLRMLGVGPLAWSQGYEFALTAVKLLLERGVECEYRIVGEGPHQDAVAFAIHQLGLDDRVEVVGNASPDALRDHLGWADVLVDVDVDGGSHDAPRDALAAGVTVVTARPPDAAAADVVEVPARDSHALCESLAAIAQRMAAGD